MYQIKQISMCQKFEKFANISFAIPQVPKSCFNSGNVFNSGNALKLLIYLQSFTNIVYSPIWQIFWVWLITNYDCVKVGNFLCGGWIDQFQRPIFNYLFLKIQGWFAISNIQQASRSCGSLKINKLFPIGSGQGYQILLHIFACWASHKTQGHARIPCIFWLTRHAKKSDTNHIPRATA